MSHPTEYMKEEISFQTNTMFRIRLFSFGDHSKWVYLCIVDLVAMH